ncbi:hypothetical protein AB0C77_15600 [Streptomyces sp. NPDC048629]|uniref:hypothetical protein n=1 Tax=Streptomyces sp. NPDC048629 TaxID=3154824 RepID=UPI0034471577
MGAEGRTLTTPGEVCEYGPSTPLSRCPSRGSVSVGAPGGRNWQHSPTAVNRRKVVAIDQRAVPEDIADPVVDWTFIIESI